MVGRRVLYCELFGGSPRYKRPTGGLHPCHNSLQPWQVGGFTFPITTLHVPNFCRLRLTATPMSVLPTPRWLDREVLQLWEDEAGGSELTIDRTVFDLWLDGL